MNLNMNLNLSNFEFRFSNFAFAAALLLCAPQALSQSPAPAATVLSSQQNPQPSASYRMMPKDTVHIHVFQEEDLETTARIGNDGNIFFPLLGKAKIGGLTVQEATASLEKLLHVYLVHPQVSVEITSYAKLHFTMLGQVNKPGIFDFPDEGSINFLDALGMAGGYSKIANPSKITIKRIADGKETIIKIDGKKIMNPKNASDPVFEVLPGDTIQVGEAIF
jgi:polysaccharide export outer membrane protein